MKTVIFSHGRDSSPAATKISALRPIAEARGWATVSVDYTDTNDPALRVERLLETCSEIDGPIALTGSSLGGLVSVFASQRLEARGLFLLAPAVYWPGYEHLDYTCQAPVMHVIHGWSDDVVPVDTSIRLAREHQARLHVLADDHRLIDSLPLIGPLFETFLDEVDAVIGDAS